MKLYLKAVFVTCLAAGLLVSLFFVWKENTRVPSETHLSMIDEMETKGLPDFELKNLEGQTMKLSQFKGKLVIVNFWASWCGPCLEEVPSLIELIETMKGEIVLVAVSEDNSPEEVAIFLKAFPKIKNENIHILMDSDHAVGKIYEADRLPESFISDSNLRLIRKVSGSMNWSSPEAVAFLKDIILKAKSK